MTRERVQFWARFGLSVALTVILLVVLVDLTDLAAHDLTELSLRPGFFLLALLAYVGVVTTRGLRFAQIHRELGRVPLARWVQVAVIHSAWNQVLPFRTGEASYVYLMRRIHGATVGRSLLVLLVARILDLMVVFVFCLAFLPLVRERLAVPYGAAAAVCAGAVAVCLVALAALRPAVRLGYRLARRAAAGKPAEAGGLAVRVRERLGRLVAEATMFRDPGQFFSVLALSCAMWIGLFTTFYALLNGFGFPIDFPSATVGSLGAVLTNVLPVNGIANVGTLEAGWTLGLAAIGIPEDQALAAGLWSHAGILVLSLGLGALGYLWLRRAERERG